MICNSTENKVSQSQCLLEVNTFSNATEDVSFLSFLKLFFKRFYLFIFRNGKGGRKKERNINVWPPLQRPLLETWPGTYPATQACTLTGNQTCNPLVCSLALNPLSHTTQDSFLKLVFREREEGKEGGGGREEETEGETDLFHLFIHSLVDSCMCADWGLNLLTWHSRMML